MFNDDGEKGRRKLIRGPRCDVILNKCVNTREEDEKRVKIE